MGRIGRRSLIRAGVAALIALTFMVCSNPLDIVGNVMTEVKTANNKFLIISDIGPAKNLTGVNPGAAITVSFDRNIDLANIENSIAVTYDIPPAIPYSLSFSYDQAAKNLSIKPVPFFGDNTTYKVTITKGVRGADGSDLQNEYSWSFKTGSYPAGAVNINGSADYTNNTTVGLTITKNFAVTHYRLGHTATDYNNFTDTNPLTWTGAGLNTTFSASYSILAGDGVQPVYIQFLDGSDAGNLKLSLVESDTIILDTVKPTVVVNTPTIYQNATSAAVPSIGATDDRSGYDPATFAWVNGGHPVTFTPNPAQAPSITATGADTPAPGYDITVTVRDKAGNQSLPATVYFIKDTVAPNSAPSITVSPATPTATPMPVWSWKGNSTAGGETTPIYQVQIDGAIMRDKFTATTYVPPLKPPRYLGLADGAHTFTIYETDNAGNLSTGSSSGVTITVFPINRSTLTSFTPTFQWHTMWDRDGMEAKYYVLHLGTAFKGSELTQFWSVQISPSASKDEVQTFVMPAEVLGPRPGTKIYWYVDMPKQGLRSPADATTFWTFANFKG